MVALCKNGHEKIEENIYIYFVKNKDGTEGLRKKCKLCRKENSKRHQQSYHVNPKTEPTIDELADATVGLITWSSLARKSGITDVALRKRAKRLGMMETKEKNENTQ